MDIPDQHPHPHVHPYTHTHTHTKEQYTVCGHACVCVCVCVWHILWVAHSHNLYTFLGAACGAPIILLFSYCDSVVWLHVTLLVVYICNIDPIAMVTCMYLVHLEFIHASLSFARACISYTCTPGHRACACIYNVMHPTGNAEFQFSREFAKFSSCKHFQVIRYVCDIRPGAKNGSISELCSLCMQKS